MEGSGISMLLAAVTLATLAATSAETAQDSEAKILAQVEVIAGHYEEMGAVLNGIGNDNEEDGK